MKLKLTLFIFVLINLLPLVSSQTYYDSNFGFSPFNLFSFDLSFSGVLDFYSSNYQLIDFFIVLALFAIISKATLEDKFGSAAPIVTALILAIGFSSLEKKYEFNLSYFGPISILLILIWFFHLLFKRAESHKGASIASISVVGVIVFILFYNFGFSNSYAIYGGGSLTLLAIMLIIYLISKSRNHTPSTISTGVQPMDRFTSNRDVAISKEAVEKEKTEKTKKETIVKEEEEYQAILPLVAQFKDLIK